MTNNADRYVPGADSTAPAVNAAESCWYYDGCSRTVNKYQHRGVYTAKNWCGDSERKYQDAQPCAGYNVSQSYDWLGPGEQTNRSQDWDAFRVDKGWMYKVQIYDSWYSTWGSPYYIDARSRSTHIWERVHGYEVAYVLAQYS